MIKRKLFFLISIFLPTLLFAQSNVKIHVAFTTPSTDSCLLIPSQYFIAEYEKSFANKIVSNKCDFSFPLSKATIATFTYNQQTVEIFVEPGDEMQVNMGADSLSNSISFIGKGTTENKFLNSFNNKFHDYFDKKAMEKVILNSDVDAFEMNLFDAKKKQLDFYNNYKDKNSFSDSFRQYVENTIRYNYYSQLLSYPIIQANQSAQILTVKAFPAAMLEGIDPKLVKDEALNCQTYRDFLFYYDVYFTSAANGYKKFQDLSISMESKVMTASKNFSGESLIWFIASYLNDNVDKVSQYTAQHIFDVLKTKENNGTYTKLLQPKVEARLAKKDVATNDIKDNSGKSAASKSKYPKLKDIDGNYFTFEDLKGKVVYVDYWASWCGPCRSQMPYSKQLHEMFTAQQLKQIVFLYISIDPTEEAWKNAVKQIGMEGRLAISPGNWNSEIAKYFQINSIPRYMLIDKKGNIVDFNAKRPSTGTEIYGDILKLLE